MILKKRQAAPEPFKVRSLAEADPAYSALLEKQQELRTARSKLDAEEGDLLFRLANDKPADAPVNRRVAALLGDEVDESSPALDGLRARFAQCQAERRDVDAALRVVDDRIRAARGAASKTILTDVEPEWRRRVTALGAALAQAHAAHAAVEEIIDALQRADVAWGRPTFTDGRAVQIFETRVGAWFARAAAAGLIDRSTIPESLK
ncbi:hypothetical protein LGR54_24630 [Ancylobacter sp. Lp-2]|uniref:hypothetical protein n=1 Tax=Ancylobacter sp. Lp-2 TaxID=2881339 RepID=UPI001E2FE720|nr:hypothetical protein [Ancylobacter sp. Lp-2]MCB4771802.1 hypothetical protein [Ancylobacter sp. Lp-2]